MSNYLFTNWKIISQKKVPSHIYTIIVKLTCKWPNKKSTFARLNFTLAKSTVYRTNNQRTPIESRQVPFNPSIREPLPVLCVTIKPPFPRSLAIFLQRDTSRKHTQNREGKKKNIPRKPGNGSYVETIARSVQRKYERKMDRAEKKIIKGLDDDVDDVDDVGTLLQPGSTVSVSHECIIRLKRAHRGE